MYPQSEQEILDEKEELDAKIEKLEKFINTSSVYLTLPQSERNRLIHQHVHMSAYSRILVDRLTEWEVTVEQSRTTARLQEHLKKQYIASMDRAD